ncbi:uncharacterized protein EAF02_011843 [Botrytis sinoallii]|uniref:uncharacterized protein n=1 Tax=Botrytis sinoallii TaxID=1463999 RepID=UPI0018FFFD24|nr:uncharacterized protein EAF02_011843 [Botrytis sinoallii]KAF7853853.1 hypothetical protein EAF02_011843 [Botrytis sinoallii]
MPVASMALTPCSNYLALEQMEVEENEKKCDESNKSTRPIRQNFDIATGSRMMSWLCWLVGSQGISRFILVDLQSFPKIATSSHYHNQFTPTFLDFASSVPSCNKTSSFAKMLQTLVIVLICIVAVIVLIGLAALINTATKKTGPNIPV